MRIEALAPCARHKTSARTDLQPVAGRATGYQEILKTAGLITHKGKPTTSAIEAQRIGAMPKTELEKALARFHETSDYASYSYLIKIARPYLPAGRSMKQSKA